jgi:hypothetical protein
MLYLDSQLADKHKANCKKPKAKRLYVRDYGDKGKQNFIPYGIVCPSCKVIIFLDEIVKQKTTLIQKEKKNLRKCLICEELGIIQPVVYIPKGGVAMECIHQSKVNHRWAQYSSFESMAKSHERGETKPKMIICPLCHKSGRINHIVRSRQKPWAIDYYIEHEKIEGVWGKQRKPRRRRCYIKDGADREMILKKLGRYIPRLEVR